MKLSLFASASRFAHLAGRAPAAGKPRAEDETTDDERKQRDGESDEDYAKRMRALDEDEDPDAEDPENDPDAEDPEEEDPEAEDPEDDDEKTKKARRAGRKAERARCAAIFGSPAAAGRADLAAELAFNTNLSAAAAIAVMKTAGPAPKKNRLDDRMSRVQVAQPGPDGGAPRDPNDPKVAADLILAAGRKARGES